MAAPIEPPPIAGKPRVPSFVPFFNPIAARLMRLGVPMGVNVLLTVRGRRAAPSPTPVALVELQGSRWIVGTFGDVNWVRNLRAAGEGSVAVGRRTENVRAVELTHGEAETFFAEVLGPYVRRIPLGRWLLGSVLRARDVFEDPRGAAGRHPVFELLAAEAR
jgi:deazaflavin-dependent oxidoreductase (nitroreductase family)